MNVPQKIIFSLLISVLIFAVFTVAAFTGLFDLVETRFYNPRMLRALNREVMEDARVIGGLLDELRDRFVVAVEEEAVKRSFLPNRTEEDTFERSRIFGSLLNSLPGLRSVRFVDAGGMRIHFSTLAADVIRQGETSPVYRSYQDCPGALPYGNVEAAEGAAPRLIFDSQGERLIFSYPFTDTLDVYRGSAFFTFSAGAVAERMVQERRIQVGEDVSVVSSPGGFLLGLPAADNGSIKNEVAGIWGAGIPGLALLDGEHAESLALISAGYGVEQAERPRNLAGGRGPEAGTVFVGRLVREQLFVFPPFMRFVLLGSFFLTVFLLVFLLFNVRRDTVTVVNSRLQRLREGLFQQYQEQKGPADWKHTARELEQRRGEVRAEIKRDLPRGKKNSPVQAEIDALIDRAWDEVVAAVGSYSAGGPAEAEGPDAGPELLEELEAVEETAEKPAGNTGELAGAGEKKVPTGFAAGIEDVDVLEELEKLEELKEPEEDKSPGEIVVTPAAFQEEAGAGPLENSAPQDISGEDLNAIASQIEFGSAGEAGEEEGGGLQLDLSSPFDALSFESPAFSGDGEKGAGLSAGDEKPDFGPGENGKKKSRADEIREDPGLTEITGDGGLPFIYQPFLFRANNKPLPLRPLEERTVDSIREQDGIHLVNSDILDPKLETANHLDPKFLQLVESILGNKT
jgi:hypothetical protein